MVPPGNPPRLAVYKRCSSDKQDVAMQDYAIAQWLKLRPTHVVTEYVDEGVSAAAKVRPAFERLLAAVAAGEIDVVLVWRFDRASRSTKGLLSLLDDFRSKNVEFVSIHEQIDTTTPAGRLMFTMIAGLAEFERDLIRERTKAGMAAARARGAKFGQPRKLSAAQRSRVLDWRQQGRSLRDIAKDMNVSHTTIREAIK